MRWYYIVPLLLAVSYLSPFSPDCWIASCRWVEGVMAGNMASIRWAFASVIGACLVPVVLVLLAGGLGSLMGCNVNEAGTPCLRWGIDFGAILGGFTAMGWIAILTVPIAALTAVVWLLTEIIRYVKVV